MSLEMKVRLPILKKEITVKMLSHRLYSKFIDLVFDKMKDDEYDDSLTNGFINDLIIDDIDLNDINFIDRNFIVFSVFLESNGINIYSTKKCSECEHTIRYQTEISSIELNKSTKNSVKIGDKIKIKLTIPNISKSKNIINWIEHIKISQENKIYSDIEEINDFVEHNISNKYYKDFTYDLSEIMSNYFKYILLVPNSESEIVKCEKCEYENTIKLNKTIVNDRFLVYN